MTDGHSCTILTGRGDLELSQLDESGSEWFADGPGGEAAGALHEVLLTASGEPADATWVAVIENVIRSEGGLQGRVGLSARQVTGQWFHATFASNRESVRRHGLDHRRMAGQGIAGSAAPEAAGTFLSNDLDDAHWFARMGSRQGCVDIWAVELKDEWLVSDPGASGGLDDESWLICPSAIPPRQLTLVERDLHSPPPRP
jgi:hypothetical protein